MTPKSFEDYFNEHLEYIRQIQSALSKPLDDSISVMDSQVRSVEKETAKLSGILSWADSYLDVAEANALKEIGPSLRGNKDGSIPNRTDLDRETLIAAAVAKERRFRNVVRGLVNSLDKRISYAQSCLKAFGKGESQRFTP